jgi:asparagine synthase (glutamine-hydrolysing)
MRQVRTHDAASGLLTSTVDTAMDMGWEEIDYMDMDAVGEYGAAELTHYTRNVLLKDTDQFSMASSIEIREPFFDHTLADFVLKLPSKWKLGKKPKMLLCDAMGDLLPEDIIYRKKIGFTLPWSVWLNRELKDIVSQSISDLCDRPEFNAAQIKKEYKEYLQGKGSWMHIWQLVALSRWMTKNGI